MISYSKIFKQAFELLRAHKFLWALGLFLVWGEVFNLVTYRSNDQVSNQAFDLSFINSRNPIALTAWTLGALFVILLFIQLYFRGKAAIIIGTKALQDKKETGFAKSFKSAKNFYLRIFGIWFVTVFLMVLSIAILVGPVLYLISMHLEGRAAILGLLGVIIFVPLALLVGFINNLAPLFVVLNDLKIGEAVNASYDLAKKFWPTLLAFTIVLGLLSAVALLLLSLAVGAGVVILGHLSYDTVGLQVAAENIILGIIAFAAFLFFGSGIASFQQISWFLLFNELVKPQKLEEEEIVPLPEIV